MVGSKRKNLAGVDVKNNSNAMESSSNITVDSDFHGRDDWVIVKKQRVNILIPRLLSNELSIVPHLEHGQLHGNEPSSMTNTPELPQEQPLKAVLDEMNDGSISGCKILNTQSSPKVNPSVDNAEATVKPRKPDLRRLNAEDKGGALTAFPRKTKCPPKFHITSPMLVRPSIHSGLFGVSNFSSSTLNPNNKLRALNLERNLSSAGGLGRWLSSHGLEQFERVFHAKNVSKFHLVNLSMKKLKDMGAHAVGPRRKLIHAIECLCKPYYKPCKSQHI